MTVARDKQSLEAFMKYQNTCTRLLMHKFAMENYVLCMVVKSRSKECNLRSSSFRFLHIEIVDTKWS